MTIDDVMAQVEEAIDGMIRDVLKPIDDEAERAYHAIKLRHWKAEELSKFRGEVEAFIAREFAALH
jgi:hypothetical protein